MSAGPIETDTAVRALAHRLHDWGVPEPASKARAFMDDLIARGWKPNLVAAGRRPPRAEEECRQHRGEYAPPICRCCHADRKAEREQEAAVVHAARQLSKDEAIANARAMLRASKEEQP